jgi:prepilin-type N-terminal cleavage/methylation domain-containing protein
MGALVAHRRRRSRGFSVMEALCAMAILVVLATAASLGGRGQLRHVGDRFDELAALNLASSRIEAIDAWDHPLVEGETEFDVDPQSLPSAQGRQKIGEIEPGLFEITIRVEYGPDQARSVELTTWMAREVGP